MWLIFTQTCLLACSWQLNSANKISWQVVFFLSCASQDTVMSEIWCFTDKLIAEKSQVENFHWCMTKGRAGQGTSIQQRSYCSWNYWEKMSPKLVRVSMLALVKHRKLQRWTLSIRTGPQVHVCCLPGEHTEPGCTMGRGRRHCDALVNAKLILESNAGMGHPGQELGHVSKNANECIV